ncbi:MAG: hypothetical protein HYR48_02700 [Gemmatimonadetes bacterium]|nr:hypothetical protein [Gemmatimonadota bacterium]
MKLFRWLTTASLTLVTASCAADRLSAPPAPEPGTLLVSLTAPHPDVGAVLLRLEGTGIGPIASANPAYQMLAQRADSSGSALHIAVIGDSLGGPLLTFSVLDVGQERAYTATVIEVADERNRLRERHDDYQLTVARR